MKKRVVNGCFSKNAASCHCSPQKNAGPTGKSDQPRIVEERAVQLLCYNAQSVKNEASSGKFAMASAK